MNEEYCIITKPRFTKCQIIGICKLSDIDIDFWISNNSFIYKFKDIVSYNEKYVTILSRKTLLTETFELYKTNGRLLSKIHKIMKENEYWSIV